MRKTGCPQSSNFGCPPTGAANGAAAPNIEHARTVEDTCSVGTPEAFPIQSCFGPPSPPGCDRAGLVPDTRASTVARQRSSKAARDRLHCHREFPAPSAGLRPTQACCTPAGATPLDRNVIGRSWTPSLPKRVRVHGTGQKPYIMGVVRQHRRSAFRLLECLERTQSAQRGKVGTRR